MSDKHEDFARELAAMLEARADGNVYVVVMVTNEQPTRRVFSLSNIHEAAAVNRLLTAFIESNVEGTGRVFKETRKNLQ